MWKFNYSYYLSLTLKHENFFFHKSVRTEPGKKVTVRSDLDPWNFRKHWNVMLTLLNIKSQERLYWTHNQVECETTL
jgi:hypothetical protein